MKIFKHKRRGTDGVLRESEHWYYKIKFMGKEKLVCTYTSDAEEAQRQADAAEREVQQARKHHHEESETSLRLSSVAKREAERIRTGVSQGQGERTANSLANFREWAGDDISIAQISTSMLDAYQDKRIADGASRETVHKELGAVCRMLRHNGFPVVSPQNRCDRVEVVREFSEDELRRFFAAAEGSVFYNVWLMLMMSGRRLAEIVPSSHKEGHSKHQPLLKSEVDFEHREIRIRLAKRRRGQQIKQRAMAIPDEMIPMLQAQIASTPDDYPYVFPKLFGIPRAFDATLKRAGIPKRDTLGHKLMAHSLRHTWISLQYKRTGDPVMLKELTGHSALKTLERYIHLKPVEAPIAMSTFLGQQDRRRPESIEANVIDMTADRAIQ